MCLVEVKVKEQISYVASCTAMVEENMEVFTHSDSLIEYRKTLLELTLSEIKWDQKSMDDTSLTNNEFKMAVEEYKPTNYFPKLQPREKVKDENPFISRDYDKCIACYRCTNICNDWEQASAITIDGRGQDSKIFSFFDNKLMNSDCTFCGQCINTCPTGALSNKKLELDKPVEKTKTKTICPYCGVGCQIEYNVKDNEIKYVNGIDGPANKNRLCVKGRFGFDYVSNPERLTKPLIRIKGKKKDLHPSINFSNLHEYFREATWDEALDHAANGFLEIKKKRNGKSNLAGFGSAKCSNEEAYLFQKLIRTGFNTNNVDHCTRLCHASSVAALLETIGSGAVTAPFYEVEHSEVIIVIGANPTENHPVAATFFKNAAKKGSKLIVMDPRGHALKKHATHMLQFKPGSDVALLNSIMNVIIEENLFNEELGAVIQIHKKNDEIIYSIKRIDIHKVP